MVLVAIAAILVVKFDVTTQVKIGVTNMLYGSDMRALTGLRVVVEPLHPELEKDGLRTEDIFRELAARVEKSGVRRLTDDEWQRAPGKPALTAAIEAVKLDREKYQYTVSLEATKTEAGGPVAGGQKVTTIWSTSGMGEGSVADIRAKINEVTELFIKARAG